MGPFFSAAVLGEDWKENASELTLRVGGAKVKKLKEDIRDFPSSAVNSFKSQPFRFC